MQCLFTEAFLGLLMPSGGSLLSKCLRKEAVAAWMQMGPSWLGTLDGPCYHRQRTFLPHPSFPLPLQRATLIQSLLPAELPELECEDEKKRQQSGINCQRKSKLGVGAACK